MPGVIEIECVLLVESSNRVFQHFLHDGPLQQRTITQ